ncbi:unnamed protein product [Cyprideis torosa]|uniref:Uncharacterized protein n=1 Tax=Cyprideis torosa TaxID=163714 RepID=A0A7R8WH60_9CRUS|nr:unnamed protein product [Cyprideis torosa]CAG0892912.1 unnamed protein product [Cyprideis torosa]
MSGPSGSGPPVDHRRKWDKEEFEKLAQDRLEDEASDSDSDEGRSKKKGPPVKRELLRHRDYKVDLDSKLGKTQVITKTSALSNSAGYYCNVCDCVVKDSINFLDHINGKKHQRNLGMSMRVERSSLDQVKSRFELLKKKKEEQTKEYSLEERLGELREEEEKLKEYRREKRQERKRKSKEALGDDEDQSAFMDPEVAAAMGFAGFGGGKKKH